MPAKFQPGNPGGPGRPRGSRNKLAEAFLEALHADFLDHGAAALEAARSESPLGYCKMIANLMPQKLEVSREAVPLSDEELVAIVRGGRAADDSDEREDGGVVH